MAATFLQGSNVDHMVNVLLSECAWGRLEPGPQWVPVGRLATDRCHCLSPAAVQWLAGGCMHVPLTLSPVRFKVIAAACLLFIIGHHVGACVSA